MTTSKYPVEFPEVKSGLDINTLPTAGYTTDPAIKKQVDAALEAYKQQTDALEQRFAQPNWFKVAAGFAKPQLGGFLASLGSASEAMGEQQEAQRAIMPTIARMRSEIAAKQAGFEVRMKQQELFNQWQKTGKPMDATTFADITQYGADTDVAKTAKSYYDAAQKGLEITREAVGAMGKDPLMPLEDWTKFQLRPDADQTSIQKKQNEFESALNAAKPPQIDQAQWNAMSRYEKMEESASYARAQRESGMGAETAVQQQATQAPTRLSLLGSIRDLAMGVGLGTVKGPDGKEITGQQQMAALLNYFGGNNPFEVLARAAADGKLSERLADIDRYARQSNMSPEAKDNFQKLSKLLAENQVNLRNGAINPTDQFSALQQAGSPNIGNSQTALVSLVDLMGHGEKNAIDKYRYILDNKVPFRQLGVDAGYLEKQRQYAEEHRRIATSNPLVNTPSWYNPAGGAKSASQAAPQPSAAPSAKSTSPQAPAKRPAKREFGDKTYYLQPDGSYDTVEGGGRP